MVIFRGEVVFKIHYKPFSILSYFKPFLSPLVRGVEPKWKTTNFLKAFLSSDPIAVPVQPHEGFLVSRTLMVCAPKAVSGMGSAGLFAFALLLHELQLIFVDFLLSNTGMQNSLGIVAAKHCLGIDYLLSLL